MAQTKQAQDPSDVESLLAQLRAERDEIELLMHITSELARYLDLTKTILVACEGLSLAFRQAPVAFFYFDQEEKSLMATLRHPEVLFGKVQPKMLLSAEAYVDEATLETYFKTLNQDPQFLNFLTEANRMSPLALQKSKADWQVAPLCTRNGPQGVFVLRSEHWNPERSPTLLDRYLQNIAISYEVAQLHQKVVETAITDGLTSLYNVRYFHQRIREQIALARRLHHPTSLIFFDVDHFKKFNDEYGHLAGDEVLRLLGKMVKANFRQTDVCARYGGEEFVVLMPHTALVDAMMKAEQFRVLVESAPFEIEKGKSTQNITITMGVAEFPGHAGTHEDLIKAADAALYSGKKPSRNIVCAAFAPPGYVAPFVPPIIRSKS